MTAELVLSYWVWFRVVTDDGEIVDYFDGDDRVVGFVTMLRNLVQESDFENIVIQDA